MVFHVSPHFAVVLMICCALFLLKQNDSFCLLFSDLRIQKGSCQTYLNLLESQHLKDNSLCCRIPVHPAPCGASGSPDPHAGTKRPGHVCPHSHQHDVSHQEGGERHCGGYLLLIINPLSLSFSCFGIKVIIY